MKTLLSLYIVLFSFVILSGQNTAIQFDGSSENLVLDQKEIFEINPDGFTIEAWIFANNWTSEIWRGSIVASDDDGPDRGYAFRCGNNGSLSFVMAVDNSWKEVASTPLMNTKQWHHVAVTIGNGNTILYIDGQAVSSAPFTGTISHNPINDVNIGASPGFGGRYFDGIIDEIRIWHTVRTPAEIADNTTSEFSGSESGLVAYLPMNDGSGTTVLNLVDENCSASGLGIDDGNWVEGYSLPEFDLSVKAITGIDRLNMKTRPIKVAVGLQNVGRTVMDAYNLKLYVNGEEVADEVADQPLPAGEVGTYVFKTPVILFGQPDVELSVELSHPDDANALNNESSAKLIDKAGATVSLFDGVVHNFGSAGQAQNTNIILPGDLSGYEKILLHIDLDCPLGGCDPWDQTAKVILNTDLGALELARYITPYGIACGPWTVDVTDFASVLTGQNDFVSFVQVWGLSGWSVNLDLEFVGESNNLRYSNLTPLWNTDYQVYGDPGISHDLAPISISAADNTEQSHVRMHVSGHGQGNTSNAAEFFQVTHALQLDGSTIADHNLWKADCATNSCTNQAGNYLFSRAGWCPGQEVIPAIFETTGFISAGNSGSLDYELQDYTNLLNTGYNSSGHTEPHYRLHGFFVEKSATPYREYTNLVAESIEVEGVVDRLVFLVSNNGTETVEGFSFNYYYDNDLVETIDFPDQEILAGEEFMFTYEDPFQIISGPLNYVYGEVIASGDQTPGDNLTSFFVGETATQDLDLLKDLSVFPNPSSGRCTVEVTDRLLNGFLELSSMEGKQMFMRQIAQNSITFDNLYPGTFILKVSDDRGHFATKKIVVID